MSSTRPIVAGLALFLSGCDPIIEGLQRLDELCSRSIIEVNTTAPGTDPEAMCLPRQPCTLRAALNTASLCSVASPLTVGLQDGETYELDDPNVRPERLGSGVSSSHLPEVTHPILVEGRGARIQAVGGPPFLWIVERGASLELRDVTLAGAGIQNWGTLYGEVVSDGNERSYALDNRGTAQLSRVEMVGFDANGVLLSNDGTLEVTEGVFEELGNTSVLRNWSRAEFADLVIRDVTSWEASSVLFSNDHLTISGMTAEDVQGQLMWVVEELRLGRPESVVDIRRVTSTTDVGILNLTAADARIESATIMESEGAEVGGIRCGPSSELLLNNVRLVNNRATTGDAGALSQAFRCEIVALNSEFTNNLPENCSTTGADFVGASNVDSDGSCM